MDDDYDSFNDDDDDSFNDDPELGDDGFSDDEFKAKDYECLDLDSLSEKAEKLTEDLAETLNVSQSTASILLRHNNWNQEKVQAAYFEDADRLLSKCGVKLANGRQPMEENKDEEFECGICDDDVPFADTHALKCGHRFCKDCWEDYLEDAVTKQKSGVCTRCPQHKCTFIVDDVTMKSIVSEASWKKFQRSVVRSFVEDSSKLKWCPAPRCERAIRADTGVKSVNCDCGFKFCFACGEEEHGPVSCENLLMWLDKCRNESETAHWIIANTKKCPKCLVRIEKNQGCNHMTCHACKHDFCWICMEPWEGHGNHTGGYYKCNKYDPKKKPATSAEEAKAELDRYLHYYQRYHNHDQSKRFAFKQREQTEKRMTELQETAGKKITWMDVQFLKAATDQVYDCRRVLKYTYAFGYFLKTDGPEKDLFEYLQQELEKNTEHLSELSERPLDKLDRQEVVNYTRVTNKFLKNLLDGVSSGLTQGIP